MIWVWTTPASSGCTLCRTTWWNKASCLGWTCLQYGRTRRMSAASAASSPRRDTYSSTSATFCSARRRMMYLQTQTDQPLSCWRIHYQSVPGCCCWYVFIFVGLQCFGAVGWAAGRAYSLSKTASWGAAVVVCLDSGADLHMAQLMPLPLTVSCFTKIPIGFAFLVPAHLGSPGKRVCVLLAFSALTLVLPFWYQPTQVAWDKGPLNGCVCLLALSKEMSN